MGCCGHGQRHIDVAVVFDFHRFYSPHDGYFHDRYRHCILGVLSTDGVSDLVTLATCKTVVKVMLLVNENIFMRAAAVRISEILLARE